MSNPFAQETGQRLMRYAAIDSQSDADQPSRPSTQVQFDMLRLLQSELVGIGAQEVEITDYGVVLATIPGTAPGPTIGFLAHVDTAPQFNATGVKPRMIGGYNGGDITFPDDPDLTLSPNEFPYLAQKIGHDLITASGTTLLGADDKAGVAIIMTAARHLLANPDIPHGPIRVAFTPDEEIGRGVGQELPGDLGVDFAYTFDGADVGELEYESFSADGAEVIVTGVSIHPGWAKDKLVNATHLAAKIVSMLPHATLTPETNRWPRRLHPLHRDDRRFNRDAAQVHSARLRTRRPGREGRTAAQGLRRCPGQRAARHDHLRDQPPIPQHALLAGRRHDPGRPRAGGLPPHRAGA